MKNHKTVFLLITAGFLAAPAFADTAEKKLQDNTAIAEATPGLLHAKMGTLFVMNRYAEAVNVSDKAYDMDKTIFVSSPYRNHYCWVFSEQGVKAKDCSYFAALALERAEKENAAKSQKDLH